MSNEAVRFLKEQIYGWVGNLMRDLDAQGTPVEMSDVIDALEQVADEVMWSPAKKDYDDFLRDLNDGRGYE